MDTQSSQEGGLASLVGVTILSILFAIMFPVMVFMYIDMQELRLENERILNKVGKYKALIERCDR